MISIADVTHALGQIQTQLTEPYMFQPEDMLRVLGLPVTPAYVDEVKNSLRQRSEVEPVTLGGQYWRFKARL